MPACAHSVALPGHLECAKANPRPFIVSHRPHYPPIMSHARSTASSSLNLQLIFNNALRLYQRRTKTNLLAQPLAARLESCETPGTVITLLQEQVQIQDQDVVDSLTKWLYRFVNVLHALSVSIGERISLVCIDTILEICVLFQLHRLSPQRM